MDIRATISGILAAICIIGAIVLTVLPNTQSSYEMANTCLFMATTFGGYVVGLYSTPNQNTNRD